MASAAAEPRRFNGRSRSESPASFQRASPWRISVRRFIGLSGRFDQDAAVLYAHPIGAQRLIGRRCQRLAAAQAEVRAVARTNDLAVFHFCVPERLSIMGATILDRIECVAAAYDNHRDAV